MLVQCSGLAIGNILVPSLSINDGEAVGFALESECGESWRQLLHVLAGTVCHPAVVVSSKAMPIAAWIRKDRVSNNPIRTVGELLSAEGLPTSSAHLLMSRIGLKANDTIDSLQLTERILLQLAIAHAIGVRLVVLSTSGLDPVGFSRVLEEVRSHLQDWSAIDLFSSKIAWPTHLYSRVVRCPAARHETQNAQTKRVTQNERKNGSELLTRFILPPMSARFEILSFLAAIYMVGQAIYFVATYVRGNEQSLVRTTIATGIFAILAACFFRASIGLGNLQKKRRDRIELNKNEHEAEG